MIDTALFAAAMLPFMPFCCERARARGARFFARERGVCLRDADTPTMRHFTIRHYFHAA